MLTMDNLQKTEKTSRQKKEYRMLNKKRKLEAFFNIALANDKQRRAKEEPIICSEEPPKKMRKGTQRGDISVFKKERVEYMESEKKKNGIISERKKRLSEEEYQELKKTLKERKKFLKDQPRFWLRENGKKATLELSPAQRIPLLMGDVQQLVLFGLVGNHIFQDHNRWCHLDHHGKVSQVMVMILEGVGYGDLTAPIPGKPKRCSLFESTFPNQIELIGSDTYDRNIVDDFSLVPLSAKSCRALFLKYGNKEAELKSKIFRTAFPVGVVKSVVSVEVADNETKEAKESKVDVPAPLPALPPTDRFSRVHLILSPSQLLEERYPLPLGELATQYGNFVMTKDRYAEVTAHSPMFGLDCEMCLTTAWKNELTRVSIVNENHELVYESLVMPYNRITNYLTQYSGITRKMMNGVKTRLKDVQRDIRNLLPPDAILVGQSLNGDLKALEMFHPYCIDTSVIFNINGERKKKTKLKTLYKMFIGGNIQEGKQGHDSVEDAAAALKLAQFKLTKSPDYGDAVLGFDLAKYNAQHGEGGNKEKLDAILEEEEPADQTNYKTVDIDVPQPEVLKVMEASSVFTIAAKKKKVGVFATADVMEFYSKYLEYPHDSIQDVIKPGSHGYVMETNYKVVKSVCHELPKFDFVITHMKAEAGSEKDRARVLNSCLKVSESLKDNSLMVVIAGGGKVPEGVEPQPESRPGCFIGVKVAPFVKL
ncbi:uncharacterized protein LOC135941164 [Cloeon dipterum]|uniref:uncharacterized protein LOC135941164 n=1 Tax=Cloeon dipterum TaxID=197152 RepID=UPI00321FBC9D